jgi:hypothetical protein
MRIQTWSLVLFSILFATALTDPPQTERKITVSGTVRDRSGALVQGAEIVVKVTNCKCSDCEVDCKCCPPQLTVTSDESGMYAFSVPHGTYSVQVRAGGRKADLELDLNEGSTKTANISVE